MFHLVRPFIHLLAPETAHNLGLAALKSGLMPRASSVHFPALETSALGLSFPTPIGLAAGFDKNAAAVDALLAQGFGFVEVGTVTPRPQEGNPQPRIFRLTEDEAVINRLGFNNEGLEAFVENLSAHERGRGIVGANIGKNKDSEDAAADYVQGLKAVYALADYITVNISSPNTPGLRALQKRDALAHLLGAICDARSACATAHGTTVPLLLKVAPDLADYEQEDIAALVESHGIDGIIVSNTTIARPESLRSDSRDEQGGLSGKPLFSPSTNMLRRFRLLTGGRVLLIGAGGVSSARDAYAKIRAGATLVQLYTALVYHGFGVVREIQEGLVRLLEEDGFSHVSEAIGADD